MNLNDRIRNQVSGWMNQNKSAIGDRELVALLRKHFDLLDTAPKDGVIDIEEVRKARATPPADFADRDIAMLDLLERYYVLLREFDDETVGKDPGISLKDLDALEKCLEDSLTDRMLETLEAAREKERNE
jgi:hypothetical protein